MHPETAKVLTLNPMNFGAKSIQMCGRYTVVHTHKELIARFRVTKALIESRARFNIAPTQKVPVVIYESQRVLEEVSWGLIPSWSKEPDKFKPLINARAETLAEKPSFRSALKKRRCLIPADGFLRMADKSRKKNPCTNHPQRRRALLFRRSLRRPKRPCRCTPQNLHHHHCAG